MKIITMFYGAQEEYNRLYSVFNASAKEIMPDVPIEVLKISEMPTFNRETKSKEEHHYFTAFAFEAIAKAVLESNEELAVCDVDLMFLKSIEDVWSLYPHFDIAYTIRNYKHPFNTGIWFYRPTKEAKEFVKTWISDTRFLIKSFYYGKRKIIYNDSGIDQAALRRTLLKKATTIKAQKLNCVEWNAEQSSWHLMDERTRIIHVKSLMRRVVINNTELPEEKNFLIPYIEKWRNYENSSR